MDASPSMSSSTTSPDLTLMDVSPRRPIALRSAEPSLVRSLLPKGIDTCTSTSGERPRKPLRRCGASTTICSPWQLDEDVVGVLAVDVDRGGADVVGVDQRAPEPSSTYSDAGRGLEGLRMAAPRCVRPPAGSSPVGRR